MQRRFRMHTLPERPSLDQLRTQAKELVKTTRAANPAYRLSQAQRDLAREYGFASWAKLVAHVEFLTHRPQLHEAVRAGDLEEVRRLLDAYPELRTGIEDGEAFALAAQNGRLEIVRFLRHVGDPDLQHALSRASMWAHEDVILYLISEGADVNGPYRRDYWHYGPPMAAVLELQNARAMRLLIDLGARLEWTTSDGRRHTPLEMLLGTYHRVPADKHACVQVCAEAGFPLPDNPIMALHASRLDRLGDFLAEDPLLLRRRYGFEEIYPASVGLAPGEGSTGAPLERVTLLHMAVEWDDFAAVRWLLDHGADPNARAMPDEEGYGDHPPLFHTAVSMGRRDEAMARLLVLSGADPSLRASVRKAFPGEEPPEVALRRVTAAEFGAATLPWWLKNETAVKYLQTLE